MKTTTAQRNTSRPVRTHCPKCGKRCYANRRSAKQQARARFPGQHMGVYACEWNGWTWYHHTSQPQRLKEAWRQVREQERESLVEEALQEMYEKAVKEGAIPWNDAGPDREAWDSPEDAVYDEELLLTAREAEQLDKALEETFPDGE